MSVKMAQHPMAALLLKDISAGKLHPQLQDTPSLQANRFTRRG